jgi:hypothetical protein
MKIDKFLDALDMTPVGDSVIFQRKRDKEHYESLLSFTLSNYHSAQYHLRNVEGFIEQEESKLDEFANRSKEELQAFHDEIAGIDAVGFSASRSGSADEYGYELAAFLVDIKTALDFLATMGSFHLRGIQADSIKTFIRLVEKGKGSRILSVISNWLDWLIALRDYRGKLVHRLVLKHEKGFVLRQMNKHIVKCRYPVVIPEETPSFVFDTRQTRFSDFHYDMNDIDTPVGLAIMSSEAWATIDDGPKILLDSNNNVLPAPGFVAIELFMKRHLDNFHSFLMAFLQSLQSFDLETISD